MNSKKGESLLPKISWQVNATDLLMRVLKVVKGDAASLRECAVLFSLEQWLSVAMIVSQAPGLCHCSSLRSSWYEQRPLLLGPCWARTVRGFLNLVPCPSYLPSFLMILPLPGYNSPSLLVHSMLLLSWFTPSGAMNMLYHAIHPLLCDQIILRVQRYLI